MTRPNRLVVVMGVAGSGKSTVGKAVAEATDADFLDADSLHPPSNVEKMAAGIPLTDDDRWPWLAILAERARTSPRTLVIACSALRRVYRERLIAGVAHARFIHLDGAPELLAERLGARTDHFMPASLLDSQLAALEPLAADENGITLDVANAVPELVAQAVRWLRVEAEVATTPPL